MKKVGDFAAELLATMCYVGYVPYSPGTAGSLVGLVLLWLVPPLSPLIFFLSCTVLLFVGVWSSNRFACNNGVHDPSHAVIDEWLGVWLSVAVLPKTLMVYVVGFCLFRFFDVLKPFPVNLFEKIPGGWGIMLDDVAAAGCSWAMLWLLCRSGILGS